MRKLILLSVFILSSSSTVAQVSGSATITSKIEVKDYKSFLEYNKRNTVSLSGDLGDIQLSSNAIIFPGNITKAFTRDEKGEKDEVEFLSMDGRQVGIFNLWDKSLKVLNTSGKEIRRVTLSHFPAGVQFAFSDKAIFAISPAFDGPGGFELFNSTGMFVKWVASEDVAGYTVSNTQKYFAVTTVGHYGYFFRLYDMNGEELWKQPIVDVGETQIKFSSDDRFAIVKIPIYWVKAKETDQHETVRKTNKLYVLDIENHKVISEEDYNN